MMDKVQHKKVKLTKLELIAWCTQLIEDQCMFTVSMTSEAYGTLQIHMVDWFALPYQINRCKGRYADVREAMPGQSGNSCPEDYD
jgi:hypothetical protein